MEEEKSYSVYVRADSMNRIVEVQSSPFISDFSGWVRVDEGTDKTVYYHAQSNYLPGGLYTDDNIPRYKLVDGKPVERAEEEIQADRPTLCPRPRPPDRKRTRPPWLPGLPLIL